MLCEKCHKSKATVFITKIVDGVSESSRLCVECSEASRATAGGPGIPDIREYLEEMKAAHCHYCGGRPCTGDNQFMSGLLGDWPRRFLCSRCRTEYIRFIQQDTRSLLPGENKRNLRPSEQIELLRAIRDAADAHMKKWAVKTGRPGNTT